MFAGDIGTVVVFKLDRLSRSLKELLSVAEDLEAKGVDLVVFDQQIDTTTPHGKLFFHMISAFAEFERGIIVERIRAGLKRVTVEGTKSGKPIGRPKVTPVVERKVKALRRKGVGILSIAKQVGCGSGTVQRILAAP